MDRHGYSSYSLAPLLGVGANTIRRWFKGTLPQVAQQRAILDLVRSDEPATPRPRSRIIAVPETAPRSVPLAGLAQAKSLDSDDALDQFLAEFDESTTWIDARPNYFSLRVEGHSMSPELPPGSLLLVAGGEMPERGDRVVARLADEEDVVVKVYSRRNNVVYLDSLNESGVNYEIDLSTDAERIIWMFPVIMSQVNERDRRRARDRMTLKGRA